MITNKLLPNIVFFLKYIWKLNKKYCLIAIPRILLSSFEPFILIIYPKLIIDGILEKRSFESLLQIVIAMIVSSLVVKLLLNVINSISTKEYNDMTFALNADMGAKVMSLKLQDIENPKVLDLFGKVRSTLNMNGLFNAMTNIISKIIILVGLIAIVSRLSILMLFVIVAIVLINVFCDGRTKKYDYDWQVEAAPYNRKFSYIIGLMFDFKYGKEIRVNDLNDYITQKYNAISNSYGARLLKVILKFLNLNCIRTLAGTVQDLLLYLYLVFRALSGQITIGDFTMFTTAIASLTSSLTSITGSLLEINQQAKFIGDFRSFMDMEALQSYGTKYMSRVIIRDTYMFEFFNVSFRYPNSDTYALKNINITIKKNEKLSIVGLNGAGKTTLVKLLTRLYEPTEGTIFLNGTDIRDIVYSDYMEFFTVVFQDFQLFAFPLSENIILNRTENKDKLMSVITESGLEEKVKSLPKGEQTEVFKIFSDEGIELSGGEAQKLAIARALYKNTPFIILDEPTAALDPLAEHEVYCKFNSLIKDKTVIYISHRLSSTKLCDNVAVFKDGEVVQYGPHSKLMQDEGGIYKDMYEKQAAYYIDVC